jgi:hypothetical protein
MFGPHWSTKRGILCPSLLVILALFLVVLIHIIFTNGQHVCSDEHNML